MPPATEVGTRGRIVGAWHTGLQVADLDRSLGFYRDLLGFAEIWQRTTCDEYVGTLLGYPGVELRVALLSIPGTDHVLELIEYRNVDRAPVDTRTANPGTAHLCLFVDDLAGLYTRLRDAGVTFLSAPVVGKSTGRLVVYACDFDGIRIELLQREPTAIADAALVASGNNSRK